MKWPPKYEVLNEAYLDRFINEATGRMAKHYRCNRCNQGFPLKQVEVNHIYPVVPVEGHDSWDALIERLYCEKDGLEVVCKTCHKAITAAENQLRKTFK